MKGRQWAAVAARLRSTAPQRAPRSWAPGKSWAGWTAWLGTLSQGKIPGKRLRLLTIFPEELLSRVSLSTLVQLLCSSIEMSSTLAGYLEERQVPVKIALP